MSGEAENCGSVLFLGLPDDVLALISARLRPRDLCALGLCCRGLHVAVAASEKAWLAQCLRLGPPPHLLPRWRRGVRSYGALCRFLAAVAPLLGIWVHQNPELGNVVCVVWGFLSVVGVRVIPQELGYLGLDAGPLLWAPVFEILADANGSPSRFFLHGRDCGEDCLHPGSVRSIDSSCNVLFLEADSHLARKYSRSRTTVASRSSVAPPPPSSSPSFTRLPFSDRRRLLELVAARIRLKVPRDLAAAPLFERSSFCDDANLLANRRLELIEMLKLSGGWIDRMAAELALSLTEHRNAASSNAVDHRTRTATDKRRAFSSVAGYLKQFMGRSTSPNVPCSISRNGNPVGGGKNKHAQLHEFLRSGDLPLQAPMACQEHAGLWGGTFGWPPGQPSEGKSGKALFFLLLSYEEVNGHPLLIATKILEGTHYVLHPNGSAMFIVKMDETTSEPFPWETDGESLQVEVKASHSGEGIANGYGFRYPGSKPGSLFVLQNGLLAFVWKESQSILTLQRVDLQELLKKGERVPVLPPIANFVYLTKSYSNVFTGFPINSGHSSSPNYDYPDGKWLDSPPGENDDGESIRDILDDLTSRLDCLSVEKPKPRSKPMVREPEPSVEYESATSSLSPSSVHSSPGVEKEVIEKGKEVKDKAARVFSLDDDVEGREEEEDDCVVLGSGGKKQAPKGEENEGESGDFWSDDDVEDSGRDGKDGDDFTMAGSGSGKSRTYRLPERVFKMLYPHQRDGLKWLWTLHCGDTGGILGDDMGLGKTMQVSAFLAGLFHSRLIKRALIVAPKTLLAHWMKELSVVGLSEKIRDYSGTNATSRRYELEHVLKEGGVLLTTYDIVRNNSKAIRGDWFIDRDESEEDNLWDYTVLDEGHIIKNPKTQRSKSISDIQSSHRIIISGTPIQNNLKELWALFNFCCPDILGDKDTFKIRYENPILRGNDKNASDREKHIGSTVAKELRERIKPYFLRRLKSEVFCVDDGANSVKLSKKSEIIVWLKLTACQRQLYEAFLNSELVHASMEGSPLAALTILKKICDHPLLLTKKGAEGVLEGMDSMLNREEVSIVEAMAMSLANMTDQDSILQIDHNMSCKISFIMSLLENLVQEGHVVLIFSQTRKMLNLIQEAITCEGYKFLRIDGTTKIHERERIVKDFQEGPGAPIFLLTSQVGGLGLTLTKADRVIVVDPAWNPSMDNQSVDRAYRIGQKNDVLVYRLMTCGTIEEKIYKMQVFKGGLFKTATEHKEQTRYFSQKDIQELFRLPEQGFDVSLTQKQLQEEHDQQHNMNAYLMKHIEFLQRLGIAGVSHHSLLFSKTAVVPTVHENDKIQSVMGNKIVRNSQSGWSNGAEHAFNPNDKEFISRRYTPKILTNSSTASPEDIESKIKRLSQTLGDKALVAKLPDSGDKIRKQISELRQRLQTVNNASSIRRKEPEVISIDDVTEELNKVILM
ncbi:unnamed protein product [Musa hybrid cultivar]